MTDEHKKGYCHICGRYGELSFEHIPPRATGNNHRHLLFTAEELLKSGSTVHTSMNNSVQDFRKAHVRYTQLQRGAGLNTICEECNNYLGQNYVPMFVNLYSAIASWCFGPDRPIYKQGMPWEVPGLKFEVDWLMPLAFFKQVISNFATCLPAGELPGVADYLRNRDNTNFPTFYQLCLSVWPKRQGWTAFAGWSTVCLTTGMHYRVTKLIIPPLVFSLFDLRDSPKACAPMGDITPMSRVPFGETWGVTFRLPLVSDDQANQEGFIFT